MKIASVGHDWAAMMIFSFFASAVTISTTSFSAHNSIGYGAGRYWAANFDTRTGAPELFLTPIRCAY